MAKYRFNWDFHSDTGHGKEGDVVELDDATADHLNHESPGVLSPVDEEKPAKAEEAEPEPEPETREVEEPPHDRQVRAAKTRTA